MGIIVIGGGGDACVIAVCERDCVLGIDEAHGVLGVMLAGVVPETCRQWAGGFISPPFLWGGGGLWKEGRQGVS